MKEIVINVLVAIAIIYIIYLFARLLFELGHVVMYRILFKDDHYKITIGFGKRIFKSKRLEINIIPLLSRIDFGPKFERGTFKAIFTYLGGLVGALLALFATIYIINLKPEMLELMGSGLLAKILVNALKLILIRIYWYPIPIQFDFFPNGGYISDSVFIYKDIGKIYNKKKASKSQAEEKN